MFIKRILLATTPEISLGLFLIFSSSVGQTFFISLFSGEIRNAFNLSHGMFGIIYSVATLTSATLFFWLGKLTDQFNLTVWRKLTAFWPWNKKFETMPVRRMPTSLALL